MGPIAVVDADAGQIHPKWAVTDGVDPIFVIVIGQPVFGEKGKIQAKEEAQEDKRQSAGEKITSLRLVNCAARIREAAKPQQRKKTKMRFFGFVSAFPPYLQKRR